MFVEREYKIISLQWAHSPNKYACLLVILAVIYKGHDGKLQKYCKYVWIINLIWVWDLEIRIYKEKKMLIWIYMYKFVGVMWDVG